MTNTVQVIEIITSDGVKHIIYEDPLDFVNSLRFVSNKLMYQGKPIGRSEMKDFESGYGESVKFEDGGNLWIAGGQLIAYSGISPDVLRPLMDKINSSNVPDNDNVILLSNGNRYWKKGVKLHRDDGPAFEGVDGSKAYYFNGKLHRKDGPAIILPNGTKEWFKDGLRHCVDGPAVYFKSGRKAWYLDGKRINKRDFLKESLAYQARDHREARLREEIEADQKIIDALSKTRWRSGEVVAFTHDQIIVESDDDDDDFVAPAMIAGEDISDEKKSIIADKGVEIGWTVPMLSLAAAAILGIFKSTTEKEKKTANKTVQVEMVVEK